MTKNFPLFLLALTFLLGFSTNSYSQTFEEAVEFIYCADEGWGESCGVTAEFDNCTVSVSSPFFGGVFRVIHFDKVFWDSLELNPFLESITANCDGTCMEDPLKIVERMSAYNSNVVTANNQLSLGYRPNAERVRNALKVVISACPGVKSKF